MHQEKAYPKSGTWHLGLFVGPETQDVGFTWDLRPETHGTESGFWDNYDRWDPTLKTNISCRIWDAQTMIQINFNQVLCLSNNIFDLQWRYKTTAAFAVKKFFSVRISSIYIYTKNMLW